MRDPLFLRPSRSAGRRIEVLAGQRVLLIVLCQQLLAFFAALA